MDFPEFEGERSGLKKALTEGGLPELNGLDQDIAAAAAIRSRILIDADDVLTDLRTNETLTQEQTDTAVVPDYPVHEQQVHNAQAALNRLRKQTDASWWIANQNVGARQMLTDFLNQIAQEGTR